MEIYLMRHGETKWNEKRLLQGRADIPLNDNGRRLAKITEKALRGVYFDCIYTSPLIRALETARIIRGQRDIPIISDDRLVELNFGENEGKDSMEIRHDENNPFHNFFANPGEYMPPKGGESLDEICVRTKDFLVKEIEPKRNDMRRVMIVAHGALNKALMCHVKGHGLDDYWSGGLQKNCGVDIVRLNKNGYTVLEESKVFYEDGDHGKVHSD